MLLLPVHIDRNKIMVVSVNIVYVMQQGGPGKVAVTFQKSSTLTFRTEPDTTELWRIGKKERSLRPGVCHGRIMAGTEKENVSHLTQ